MRQRLQRAILPVHAPVQPRVVDRHRDARGDQTHQRAILLGVRLHARRLHIEHAHQLAARHHRHRQFAAHRVERVQIARILANVVHQHRLRVLAAASR